MTPHQEPLEPVATGQGLRERGGRAQEGQSWSRPPAPEIWNVWSVFSPTFGLAKTSSRRLRSEGAERSCSPVGGLGFGPRSL